MNDPGQYAHINFVPQWYVEQRVQRASRQRQMVLVMIMLIGMGVLWGMTRQKVVNLQQYHQALQDQVNAAEFQLTEVAKLQNAKRSLAQQVHIYREIARPIGFGQINATIGAMTPDAVFLERMDTRTKTIERRRVIAGGGENGRDKTVVDRYELITIDLEGVAPSDVEIANYIGRLAGSSLFRNVKMEYSRQGRVGEAVTREFKISMDVPLDREYRLEAPQEVADAR